jgi:hypothetical protein
MRPQRLDQSMEKGGFDAVVVGDQCVWFHGFNCERSLYF